MKKRKKAKEREARAVPETENTAEFRNEEPAEETQENETVTDPENTEDAEQKKDDSHRCKCHNDAPFTDAACVENEWVSCRLCPHYITISCKFQWAILK